MFVRADLGQIEPRILAAVSGDAALAKATAEDDMYPPWPLNSEVDRATAKVAVLGAMYGQTTGHGAAALRGLALAYPVAVRYLTEADLAGQVGRDIRTYGGRLVRMGSGGDNERSDRDNRSRAAAQGRYGRNAMVQGAAAEFFKVWAVTVRSRASAFGAEIVLCLHDELLVHAPTEHGDAVAGLLSRLDEAAPTGPSDAAVRRRAGDRALVRRQELIRDVDPPTTGRGMVPDHVRPYIDTNEE
jgi:DNA polymerase-1